VNYKVIRVGNHEVHELLDGLEKHHETNVICVCGPEVFVREHEVVFLHRELPPDPRPWRARYG
jgi:hypothetical protein